jgi:hypothetical protein
MRLSWEWEPSLCPKARTGTPVDDAADHNLPIWMVSFRYGSLSPIPDSSPGIKLEAYATRINKSFFSDDPSILTNFQTSKLLTRSLAKTWFAQKSTQSSAKWSESLCKMPPKSCLGCDAEATLSCRWTYTLMKYVALLGEFTPSFAPHLATSAAVGHSRNAHAIDVTAEWVATKEVTQDLFLRYSGVWIAPGSPYRDMQKVLWAIQHARMHRVPCLGTCGGFQHMVLEYARNVLGFADAQHAEYVPTASRLFISKLECSLVGRELKLSFVDGSKVADIYGTATATERYYCNFGVNPDQLSLLKSGPLQVTGSDSEGEARVIELPSHPFFLGTLFVPQSKSTPTMPHPLVDAFLRAVASTP